MGILHICCAFCLFYVSGIAFRKRLLGRLAEGEMLPNGNHLFEISGRIGFGNPFCCGLAAKLAVYRPKGGCGIQKVLLKGRCR
jgi:hypothetical protein